MSTLEFCFQHFRRLSAAKKYVFFGALGGILTLFFPWYEVDIIQTNDGFQLFRVLESKNAFAPFPIFGVLLFLFSISTLCMLAMSACSAQGRKVFGFPPMSVIVFLAGQSFFTLALATFVLLSQMQADSTMIFRFGIFFSFLLYGLLLLGSFLAMKEEKRNEIHQFFTPEYKTPSRVRIRPEEPQLEDSNQLSFSDIPHG